MDDLSKAIRFLKTAKRVSCLTGAGISAESGIQTFRDKDGVWNKIDPMKWATVQGFLEQPREIWLWYEQRREQIRGRAANPGHFALAKLENHFEHFSIATQNIDGFHQLSGSKNVYELHGNIMRNKCFDENILFEDFNSDTIPPKCHKCGAYIRPDVVWFGEQLPQDLWTQAFEDASNCDVYFVIDTSGVVYPAAGLATIAKRAGAKVIIINKESTELDMRADAHLTGLSGEILPKLLEEFLL
jgi:NAD-dependent deacetylase